MRGRGRETACDGVPRDGGDGSRAISFCAFDTDVRLHAYPLTCDLSGSDPEAAGTSLLDAALIACRERCVFFERRLSRTRPDSDLSRVRDAAPDPVAVAPETAELVRLALGYCAASKGCFDITMGAVTRLWDFHRGVVPGSLQLARALAHVGVGNVGVSAPGDEPMLSVADPECGLDLGGIAKGYIADDLSRLLEGRGVGRFAINLGGNVVVRGGRPGAPSRSGAADPWRVGVVDPRDPSRHRIVIEVADGSVVTSGLHERRFAKGGRTYHHILSPEDGMPARTDVLSATIVADRSIDCDGFSTTALMLGMERGLSLVEGLSGVEAALIGETGEVRWTPGLDGRVSLVAGPRR